MQSLTFRSFLVLKLELRLPMAPSLEGTPLPALSLQHQCQPAANGHGKSLSLHA